MDAPARRVSADSEGTLRRAAEGGLGVDCMKGRHREGLLLSISAAARDGTPITLPGPPDDPESFRKAYGGDPLDDDTLAFVVDPIRCVEDTVHHYFQPVHVVRVDSGHLLPVIAPASFAEILSRIPS
jgi:hypothetical protein